MPVTRISHLHLSSKTYCLLVFLNVPQGTGGVPRAGDDLVVIQEATAQQVAGVARQLPADPDITLMGLETVDGADVV